MSFAGVSNFALVAKGIVRAVEAATGLSPSIPREVFDYASLYWFVDSAKAKRELGYEYRPANVVFAEVVAWLAETKRIPRTTSFRYGGGAVDARSVMIRAMGMLQRKKIVLLDSNPEFCGKILAASDKKGDFIERLVATPAWHPIYSIESMDGERWDQLARDFKTLLARLEWRERLPPLIRKNSAARLASVGEGEVVGAEEISRWALRVLFELLFARPIAPDDETLFYRASLEWRREIAVKGKADERVKAEFWARLAEHVRDSRFKEGLITYENDPSAWLSLFAQPFLVSPQINFADIFVAVFSFLRADPVRLAEAKRWAAENDRPRLDGIVLEAIRLRHPFPILERELRKDTVIDGERYASGTQFFILLDQFRQDPTFDPERWLRPLSENPYSSLPFAAGPRMCIGKPIAMELLAELLKILLLEFPDAAVRPEFGHRYSGRNNDGPASDAESKYQAGVFARLLWKSFKIGRGGGDELSVAAAPECPWKKFAKFRTARF